MTAFIALAGLAYVYLTLQLYHLGERRKAVETELADLHKKNDTAASQIALFTSRTALQHRLKEGYLKMVPDLGLEDRAAHNSSAIDRRRGGSTRRESFAAT